MGMELSNTGVLFQAAYSENAQTNIDPKYIKFNSEIAIRKGNQGWIINSRIDNWSSDSETYFEYLLTTYKYEGDQWKKDGDPKLWGDPSLMDNTPQLLTRNSGDDTINNQNKLLVIRSPEGFLFNGSDWVSPSSTAKTKTKALKETKSWSGIWIDNNSEESSSWIFQDIELYVGEKKYSQVFCSGTESECFQLSPTGAGLTAKKPHGTDTWSNAFTGSQETNEKIQNVITTTVKGIINALKNSKGSWAKLEDICEVEVSGTPDEERQKQLRMYCSNGKKVN